VLCHHLGAGGGDDRRVIVPQPGDPTYNLIAQGGLDPAHPQYPPPPPDEASEAEREWAPGVAPMRSAYAAASTGEREGRTGARVY
jgi:hypothetical protein